MKIKKHLVAATLALGLAGSAGAMTSGGGPATAQAGYVVVKFAAKTTTGPLQVAAQAGGASLAGLGGAKIGAKIGAAAGVTFGGPAGMVAGAMIGAL